MFKFVLVILAIYAVSADIGANIGNVAVSRTFATCLKGQNVARAVVELVSAQGTFNTNFINSFIYLMDANITNVDATVRVNDSWDAEKVCTNITRALPQAFSGTVWLNVDTGSWNKEIGKRIDYLEDFALNCRGHGFNVGVYSKVTSWTLIFGSPTAGSDKLRTLPVWYFNDNGADNFNDFRYSGFGKWASATMKEYKSGPYICSNYLTGLEFY